MDYVRISDLLQKLSPGVLQAIRSVPPDDLQKIQSLPAGVVEDLILDVLQKIQSVPPDVLQKIQSLSPDVLQKIQSLSPGVVEDLILAVVALLLRPDVLQKLMLPPPGPIHKLILLLPDVIASLPPDVLQKLRSLVPDAVQKLPLGEARETSLQEKNMELQKELERGKARETNPVERIMVLETELEQMHFERVQLQRKIKEQEINLEGQARETNLQEKNMELQKELEQRQLKSAQLRRKIKEQEINLEAKKSRSAQLQQKIKEQEIKLKQPGRFPCYRMSRRPRGICVIINNINFRGEHKRVGAEFDESELVRLFKELQFEVHPFRDLQWDEMRKKAVDFSKRDHSQFDAFAFIVMSHGGDKDVIYGVSGRHTRVEDLMTEFKAANCPTLGNKPKLFLIQTCRGSSNDSLSPASCGSDTAAVFSPDSTLARSVCPQEADFLLSFATAPGYKAWRYPGFGTPYIQFLVEEIRKHHQSHHLLDILTEVNRRVVEEGIRDGKAIQCPAPTHTLQRQVFL